MAKRQKSRPQQRARVARAAIVLAALVSLGAVAFTIGLVVSGSFEKSNSATAALPLQATGTSGETTYGDPDRIGALIAALTPSEANPDFRPGQGTEFDIVYVALVIDDMGIAEQATRNAMTLPSPVTFAFLPYGRNAPILAAEARAGGHEILIHMPMEPATADSPGPGALLTSLSANENLLRLRAAIARFETFDGLNNHMGSRMTADETAMRPVLEELRRHGVLFLDSRTTHLTVAGRMARDIGMAAIDRDIFLDDAVTADNVMERLRALELVAHQRGVAVAIGHPHDVTIKALRQWIATLAGKRIQLVGITRAAAFKGAPLPPSPVSLDR